MSFVNQFKVILWKNYKLFKQRTYLFVIGMECLVTIMFVCTLGKSFTFNIITNTYIFINIINFIIII